MWLNAIITFTHVASASATNRARVWCALAINNTFNRPHVIIIITRVVSHLARVTPPTLLELCRACHRRQLHQLIACMFIYSTKWPQLTHYECQKYEKKSQIHENADANITCDFGDGDISRSRSRFPHTHTVTHTHR